MHDGGRLALRRELLGHPDTGLGLPLCVVELAGVHPQLRPVVDVAAAYLRSVVSAQFSTDHGDYWRLH